MKKVKLKDFLGENDVVLNIPNRILRSIAEQEYCLMHTFLEEWYENSSGEFTLTSLRDVYEKYKEKSKELPISLKDAMTNWWQSGGFSRKKHGEALNEAILSFFKDQEKDIPLKEIPNFNEKEFGELFKEYTIGKPTPDFYSFFNPETGVFIRYAEFPRMKYIPFILSKKRIIKKFEKNSMEIEDYIFEVYETYYHSYYIDGKRWNDYIVELVKSKVADI